MYCGKNIYGEKRFHSYRKLVSFPFIVLSVKCIDNWLQGPSSFPIFSVTKYTFWAIFKNPAFAFPFYDTGYGSGEFKINNVI